MGREEACSFTGHRNIQDPAGLSRRLEEAIREQMAQGIRLFCCGGALGFDTLAAQTVLRLRQRHPEISLVLVLPCQDQADRWGPEDRAVYESIKRQADQVIYTEQWYQPGCMYKRNRYLVDHTSRLISYLRRPTGGTAYTVGYAEKQGVPVIPL